MYAVGVKSPNSGPRIGLIRVSLGIGSLRRLRRLKSVQRTEKGKSLGPNRDLFPPKAENLAISSSFELDFELFELDFAKRGHFDR